MAKIEFLEIAVPAGQFNSIHYIDAMNNTRVWVNDVECEPDNDDQVFIPQVVPGDLVHLDTRSSGWIGNVTRIDSEEVTIAVEAEGVFASITNGLSGLITWRIRDERWATVETSMHDGPVPWPIYVHTKAAADFSSTDTDQRNQIWSKLIDICMVTVEIKSPPEWWGQPVETGIIGAGSLKNFRLMVDDLSVEEISG